jgi:hypothetical protein
MGPGVKKISFEFISQYEADVKFLDNVLLDYPYLQDDEIFVELKQVNIFRQDKNKRLTTK